MTIWYRCNSDDYSYSLITFQQDQLNYKSTLWTPIFVFTPFYSLDTNQPRFFQIPDDLIDQIIDLHIADEGHSTH